MSRQATRHFRGDRLNGLRLEKKIAQEDLAITLGVRVRTIQRWEDPSGSEPSGHDVMKLARALDCAPDFFYELEEAA